MDYYQATWLVLLLSAVLLNVIIYLIFSKANPWVRGFFTSAAISLPLFPVIVETEVYGQAFAPLLAQIAVDLLSGSLSVSEILLPVSLLLLMVFVLCFLLSKLFARHGIASE